MATQTQTQATKKKPTQPWRPAPILAVTGKKPGFGYRWVRPDQVDKRLAEGWELVKKGQADAPAVTGIESRESVEDDNVRRRDMYLMRAPKELIEARDAYYRAKGNDAINEHARS